MVYLVDQRFKNIENRGRLSKWARDFVDSHDYSKDSLDDQIVEFLDSNDDLQSKRRDAIDQE